MGTTTAVVDSVEVENDRPGLARRGRAASRVLWRRVHRALDPGSRDTELRLHAAADPYLVDDLGIELLYVGGAVPHNEGSGGVSAQGPGPLLNAQWNLGFTGRFQARIYPATRAPLPVPPAGVNIPVTFTITHP